MVSVIVVTYNQEKTIGRTLDSILMQQCHLPIEIVIGEDGSKDKTRVVCQEYAEKYPNVIRLMANKGNQGIVDNYFDCLLACKGEYIADCAGDDFWTDPHKLEKEVHEMEADEKVTLVHTAWSYYDESTGVTTKASTPYHYEYKTDGKKLLTNIITQTRFPVIHLCTSLYRRDTIIRAYEEDTLHFRNKDFGCEDLSISCALAHAGTIVYLPDVTLNYTVNHVSISNAESEENQFDFVKKVTVLSYSLSKKYKIELSSIASYFSYRIFALAMHAFRAHNKKLRDEVKQLKKQWNAQPTIAYRIVQAVMSNNITWEIALGVRALVVKLKN